MFLEHHGGASSGDRVFRIPNRSGLCELGMSRASDVSSTWNHETAGLYTLVIPDVVGHFVLEHAQRIVLIG